ncbi:hypothetical protein [Streptomyces sp. 8L]|uniref:hypothetical protein n=1 Tax=Streptomyces sp. 8L TaxID=2877242 RepID=UPI001CD43FE1|nr:hypothetical protein [Streptomyces sp. 8L]MCA1220240.1 hypothetical protein [Streptomyces sp. 8L]
MNPVHLDLAYWLGLLTSVVLPVLVGLVTSRVTNSGVKAVLLLALSALNGFLVEFAAPHPNGYSVGTAAVLTLVSFGTGVLTHFGLWKPTTISAKAQALGAKKPTPAPQNA